MTWLIQLKFGIYNNIKGNKNLMPKICLSGIKIILSWLFLLRTADTGDTLKMSRGYPFLRDIYIYQ